MYLEEIIENIQLESDKFEFDTPTAKAVGF